MGSWTWPSVVILSIVVAAIVALFGLADDPDTRSHLLGYMDKVVVFVIGAGAGGAIGFQGGLRAPR